MRPSAPIGGFVTLVALIALVAGCGAGDIQVRDADMDAAADFSYTIPPGAGLAADAGTPLEILPAQLDARVGQTVQIVNHDDRGHLVGPWFVGAGETLRQTFASPGEFQGSCTVHPSGEIKVVITP